MDLNLYQFLAGRTINRELTDEEKVAHAVYGLASEAGEICGIFQKHYQGHEVNKDHLVSEMGDAMWMISEMATGINVTLEEVAAHNIEKLRARYPEGFAVEKSINRKDGDI